ncbi:MAG: hypothetical protein WCX65_07010, partial [bacterium]
ISTIAVGTSPLAVTSTTVVANLNSDQLDGYHASSFILDGCTDCLNATEIEDIYVLNTSDTMSGSLSVGTTLGVTGAATLSSTLGVTGAITGSSTVQGTQLISTVGVGTAPLTVTSTTAVTNLNADMLDGYHASSFILDGCTDCLNATEIEDIYVLNTSDTMSGSLSVGTTLGVTGAITGASTVQGTRLISTIAVGTSPLAVTSTTVVANLNSDQLDGYHASSFILDGCTDCLNATEIEDIYVLNTSDTMSGSLSVGTTLGVTGAATLSSTLGVTGAITGASTVQGTRLISTIAVGTSPLAVTSTTVVANLNSDQLDGYHSTSFILDGCTDCLNATEIADIYVLNTSDTMSGSLSVGTTLGVTGAATLSSTLGVTGAITGSSTVQGTRLISTVAVGTAPLTVTSTTAVTNLNADMLDGYHSTSFILDGCTDCLNATEIEDIYVLNSGDTMTGALTMGGNRIWGQNGVSIDMGVATAEGFRILDDAGSYPDIYCNGSGSDNLCEFKTGIYNNGNTFYNQNVLMQREYIQNDGAGYSGRVYISDSDGLELTGPLVMGGNTAIDAGAGWHRSYGATGWYNGTYAGGWYMTDTTYVRSYNAKPVLAPSYVDSDNANRYVDPSGNSYLNRIVSVDDTTVVTNLNADLIDGRHFTNMSCERIYFDAGGGTVYCSEGKMAIGTEDANHYLRNPDVFLGAVVGYMICCPAVTPFP